MIEESIEGSDLYDAPPQPQRRSRRTSVPLNDPPDSGDDPAAFQDGLQGKDSPKHRSGFAKVDELVETIHKRFDSLEKTNESFVTQINQHPGKHQKDLASLLALLLAQVNSIQSSREQSHRRGHKESADAQPRASNSRLRGR
ncbi:hypothetical protein GGTG_07843 [Gaeumannomyces tritici R3-111a-1]|uniref:Uncharacterized protein n=1 Tax=Gaeumannomyces tritici (strain R3-111a-1) TaxID=644352 RepID=J3P2V1_GAET3|nr:hypothetical protein GGTG_07843 [Gaeumannomyces tritici R3-111a-1]EJT73993.1 hypothetical protein GGTG_07843 [Gaeumannomyces tritici R3-111a-1]